MSAPPDHRRSKERATTSCTRGLTESAFRLAGYTPGVAVPRSRTEPP